MIGSDPWQHGELYPRYIYLPFLDSDHLVVLCLTELKMIYSMTFPDTRGEADSPVAPQIFFLPSCRQTSHFITSSQLSPAQLATTPCNDAKWLSEHFSWWPHSVVCERGLAPYICVSKECGGFQTIPPRTMGASLSSQFLSFSSVLFYSREQLVF